MANINIPFNCDYESINITVKCPVEGTDKEEQTIIAQLKKENEDWVFCTPGSIVSKNVKILNNEGSYEVIDSNGNFRGKIVGDILSSDGQVIVNVDENKVSTKDLVVSNNTVLNNVTINGKLTLNNGTDIINLGEKSGSSNQSVVVFDNTDNENMGLFIKNGAENGFLGFSKENNMFEIKTGTTLSNNKVSGGEFGDLKARNIIAEDIILGNKEKGEREVNLHDIITSDGKGSAHITTNSLVTMHHSSVFHTAISTDLNCAQRESDVLNNLTGDLLKVYNDEKKSGRLDSDPHNLTGKNETFNQHWLTINEAEKNPKFKWWVATNGDYSNKFNKKVEFTDVLTVSSKGIDVKGKIKLFDGTNFVDFDSNNVNTITTNSSKISNLTAEINLLKKNMRNPVTSNSINTNDKNQIAQLSVELEKLKKTVNNQPVPVKVDNSKFDLLANEVEKLKKEVCNCPEPVRVDTGKIDRLAVELEKLKKTVSNQPAPVKVDTTKIDSMAVELEKLKESIKVHNEQSKVNSNSNGEGNIDYQNYLPVHFENSSNPIPENKPYLKVINKGKSNEKVFLVNFQNNNEYYYQLNEKISSISRVNSPKNIITDFSSNPDISKLQHQINELNKRLSQYEQIMPVITNINRTNIKKKSAYHKYNTFPLIYVNDEGDNKASVSLVSYRKQSDTVHYYQLNNPNVKVNSGIDLKNEISQINKRLEKREKLLPIVNNTNELDSRKGKSVPFFLVEGKGDTQTIKFINRYNDGSSTVEYYYQLNNKNLGKSVRSQSQINSPEIVSLINTYKKYLPIYDAASNRPPPENKPYIKITNRNKPDEKVYLVNFQNNNEYFYQLNTKPNN